MILVVLALAMQVAADRATETRQLQEATVAWLGCTRETAIKWSPQSDGADTIATAAMAECREQQEMYDAREQLDIMRFYQEQGALITPATLVSIKRILGDMHDRVRADMVALIIKTRATARQSPSNEAPH